MALIYVCCLLLGGYIFFHILRQKSKVNIGRKTIVKEKENTSDLINVREIVINNSFFLSLLSSIDKSIALKVKVVSLLSFVICLAHFITTGKWELLVFLKIYAVIFIMVMLLPMLVITPIVGRNIKTMRNAIPYFIDLVAVCIQTGMTIEMSIQFVSEKFDKLDANISTLMKLVVQKSSVIGFEEAINQLYKSLSVTEMRMFCSSLQQSVHYGTPLYENLMELSKDIRLSLILESEEKVGKLSARMTIPLIVFIMFPLTVLIIAPGLLRIMKNVGL